MVTLPFPLEDRYYRFSRYLRQQFGQKIYRISLDAGFSCPTRDGRLGKDGCLYCDNSSFAQQRTNHLLPVKEQLIQGIASAKERHKARKFLAYFQAYTNTYAAVNQLEITYRSVMDHPDIVGIIIGTRPDCIDDKILDLLKDIAKDIYLSVEYGIESVYNKTLKWAHRGHEVNISRSAVEKTKNRGIHTGGHIIFGFPTETRDEILSSAPILNRFGLDALKIHHLHIVRNSALAPIYKNHPFPLFGETEWIELICNFLEHLDPHIVIQRLMGDAKQGTLIAPQWSMSKIKILQAIQSTLAQRKSHQGYLFSVNS